MDSHAIFNENEHEDYAIVRENATDAPGSKHQQDSVTKPIARPFQ